MHRLYLALARLGWERTLPSLAAGPQAVSPELRKEVRQSARYFSTANLVRAAILAVPMALASLAGQWLIVMAAIPLLMAHLIFMAVESHKRNLAERHLDGEERPQPLPARIEIPGWQQPRAWEKRGGWRFLEIIQSGVTAYVRRTRLSEEERQAGEEVDYLGGSTDEGVLRFARATCIGEVIHLVAGTWNLALLVMAMLGGLTIAAVILALTVFVDYYLAMLQRHLRSRAWSRVQRALRRRA